MRQSIALVGMPGSGKSTAGKLLGRRLGATFVDTDARLEARLGESIRSFFEREGEARFRDLEAAALGELTQGDSLVIATGGGMVLRAENREALRRACVVFYLRSSPEELYRRLRNDTHRPLLQVPDPLRRLQELLRERDPLYRQTAHHVVDIGRPTVQSLVNTILSQLQLAGVVDASDAVGPVTGADPKTDGR
ncbi:shikimate kinase [Rhizobacter sp. P5_C2]